MSEQLPLSSEFALTPAERRRLKSKKHGHAAPPGTGPAGETCRTCAHLHREQLAKTYLKCSLMRRFWTGGYGTDIRASDPACKAWQPPSLQARPAP